ncbi:TPA: hypothetical protein DIU27_01345 [Candidatus Collierbacteria bacterium]|uniref:Uncharacterized protein n=1 Tax=Candidatus Collierbacteria bacterium GW2011_GWB2_44_22 TaxID=1618387 RepID=A0A0G1HYB5_9BACT|nr:MAG: hypothetical protein UW31_C0015G0020 [Candidatus Collierbacteria bacterium GW2011_GWA2_44_13]KKT52121.1 MAG: hypothetical protein UW44_C0004G0026 [Candidatus Collierbacteria bacterium GW2011_GWB2_44_22]KKT61772.1 MAG: hypothetical protein UW56_C0018G0002 [Candidatus Collierbacteria bacterium GW2011_GWD1_44_27]KKT65006.1 MAG: hypothetical protein UW58_C0032G0009 [Candidatus Collierbacteria bacterium GW2011_GWC2_44_30]KKT68997.1 MAG: hypothetical protein UW64_C0006G0053 [Microgenomates gr
MNKYYFVPNYPKAYKKLADRELSAQLERLGFKYRVPELGGGVGEIINHILAYLSIDTTQEAITSGLLTNLIWQVIKNVYQWNKHYSRKNYNSKPSINIYIYSKNKTKNYFLNIAADKEYKKSEVDKIVISEIKKGDSAELTTE